MERIFHLKENGTTVKTEFFHFANLCLNLCLY